MKRILAISRLLGILALLGLFFGTGGAGRAQANSHYFPETKHTVSGVFWTYWQSHGGLAQQGYPISEEMQERSTLNGQTYTVQYFERAVFEKHPENKPPFDVLLSQLGTFRYKSKYASGAPNQHASTVNPRLFPETKHTVGGTFRAYWEAHGGLAQQGYPISEEFTEVSTLDGKPYTVQYFERAVFEKHPENKPPFDVLLSQLGTFRYRETYASTPPPTQVPAGVTVHEIDFDFAPRVITIPAGTKVTWINDGPTEHTVADKDVTWSSDILQAGQSYSHVFTTPGTVTVICTLHPEMISTVIVK